MKKDATQTKGIYLVLPTEQLKQINKLADTYFLTQQDVIRQFITEKLNTLPKKEQTCTTD